VSMVNHMVKYKDAMGPVKGKVFSFGRGSGRVR
jgi:hypothetical protein